jgi:hypothetical protein
MPPAHGLADEIREREQAFQRFAQWQAANPVRLDPRVALAAVGALYERLPTAGRRRHVDPAGVMAFHPMLRRSF